MQQGPQGPFEGQQPPQQWQGQYPPQGQPYQQPPPFMPQPPRSKWYRTNPGIIALLVLFFPVGLYLMWRYSAWSKTVKVIVTGILAVLVLISSISNAASSSSQAAPSVQQTVDQPTQPPDQPTPTTQAVQYPPKTKSDLQGLAAQGDTSVIHEFHGESVGLTGVCPQPKREVTVDGNITGKQLAEDLLAYYYTQNLDNPCGAIVFAYHSKSDSGNGYTAGRVKLDVTDENGQSNIDPNGQNLKYTLTLDIGDYTNSQEYIVSY